jgi:hypothetical protein
MLLRKAMLVADPTFHILPSATTKMSELAPPWKNKNRDHVNKFILDEIARSVEDGHVFENPAREGQYVIYAELGKKPLWFVAAPNDVENSKQPDAAYVVITVLMHKDKHFRDEMTAVEADCG